MNDSKHGLSILYVAVFLLSLNGLFSKLIPLDAITVTQMRSLMAAIALFGFAYVGKRGYRLSNIKQYAGVSMLGLFLGFHWITFFHAMQISTVAIGMLSFFTYPVITVFIEPFFNQKRIQKSDVFAAMLVLIGIVIMVSDNVTQYNSHLLQGAIWGVLSAFLFAIRNVIQKYKFADVPSDGLILYQVIAIAIILLMFIDVKSVGSLGINDWLLLILLGAVSTAMAHTLFSFSLKHLPAKTVAMIACLQPSTAAVFAWLILDEVPSNGVMLGGAIIVSVAFYESVYYVNRRNGG